MVRELVTGAPNQYEGLSEHPKNLGMQRNGEKLMDSAQEGKDLPPGWISSSAGNSGMRRILRMDSP